jgi:hypothetical protein
MKVARYVFLIAGIYGILVIAPMYFFEKQIGADYPPAITHPEYFYGFIGVTLAWQVVFLLIARDPARYRVMMLPAMLEKFGYTVAILWLFADGRVPVMAVGFGLVDCMLGVLFVIAFLKTKGQ